MIQVCHQFTISLLFTRHVANIILQYTYIETTGFRRYRNFFSSLHDVQISDSNSNNIIAFYGSIVYYIDSFSYCPIQL